jgi:thiamine-phosphate pyrophosphorylase
MNLNKLYKEEFYLFLEEFTEIVINNIKKFPNLSIIYNNPVVSDLDNFLTLSNFCKKNNINLYIVDNFEVFLKFKLSGIVLSDFNKNFPFKIINYQKKNIKIIGKVHSQMSYYFKKNQRCTNIFLSPIFANDKYKAAQLLGVIKFNLISANWRLKVFPLGGINLSNLKKISLTRSEGIGFARLIYTSKIKKPVLFIKGRV